MATLLLQVAGSALGNALGGSIGGMIGQALGGIAGATIDQSLLGGGSGNRVVDGPRLKEIDGLASSEGAAIPRVYGRTRLGGQLIWATRFEEDVTVSVTRTKSGAKGARSQKTYETTYNYYVNLAIGLCEGPISFVRRVWADGRELDLTTVTMRLHRGEEEQDPDPLIVAKEGGETPAYRGLAYVVFERFPLADYGNRVPQFSFEVVRAVGALPRMVGAVTLIPGAGEFVYEARAVQHEPEPGISESLTRHQLHDGSDIDATLAQLRALCPALERVSLVVSWFGDDLRAGSCTVAPRVEIAFKPTHGDEWSVAGLLRPEAWAVSQVGGRPAFGGTPSDASVMRLIRKLRDEHGLGVVLYPFLMMDIPADNVLPDPVTGEAGQPAYPWRGSIVGGAESDADLDVAAFVGTVAPADMSLDGDAVACAKPEEWSYRRLVMHCAMLAKAAGGVEGFVIGSELVGLTRQRGAAGYPMTGELVAIAEDVRDLLPGAQLTYAADWTEYGAHVRNGGADIDFPLDPLWSSPAIDAIGIDFYAPLSDWRDATDHADAQIARGPADVAYLRSRLTAGEAFDWYYADAAGRAAQDRLPITDGSHGKPWIYRPKDIVGWWSNFHVARADGAETGPTAFIPGDKPVWLTELGIPAIDKGANAPHVFPDPKSAQSGLPYFSSGARDDLIQARALEALLSGLDPALAGFDAARNPRDPTSGLRMINPSRIFLWSWDARPFPAFPTLAGAWADGAAYDTGHWLNGRVEGAPVDHVLRALLADFGLPLPDSLEIDGFLDGYVLDRPMSARQALEPLAQAFGFDATMTGGRLFFRGRGGAVARNLDRDDLVPDRDGRIYELRRAQESELPRELRLGYCDPEDDYRVAAVRSRRLAGAARREQAVETAIVTREAEAQRLADQRLQEVWAGRETAEFALSPRCLGLEPGDIVSLQVDGAARLLRLTRLADGPTRRASARAVEPSIYTSTGLPPAPRTPTSPPALPGRPWAIPLVLPIARAEPPALLSLAAFAAPWPGALAVWRDDGTGSFALDRFVEAPSIVGETLVPLSPGPLWRTDRRAMLDVRLRGGMLSSVPPEAALAGANALALLDDAGAVEIVTAARVELIGDRTFRLSNLVRGLGGSETAAGRILPAGCRVVVLDGASVTLASDLAELGLPRRYRVGAARFDPVDPAMAEFTAAASPDALLPLAPVSVRARRHGGAVVFSWIRRTRIDGDSWDVAEVPLGEAAERYEIVIVNSGAALRRAEVSEPSWTYPEALELADFGTAQAEMEVAVSQHSAVAGRGREWRGRLAIR